MGQFGFSIWRVEKEPTEMNASPQGVDEDKQNETVGRRLCNVKADIRRLSFNFGKRPSS